MKAKPFHTFHIPCDVYRNGINVLLTKDIIKAVKYVETKLVATNIKPKDFRGAGKVFYRKEFSPVLWLSRFPRTPFEIGTATHELFHALCKIMWDASTKLNGESEEPYAYLMGYLTEEFFKHKPK